MPLPSGTRLGRYEVIRLLGAGGMGEVYLAKDERLEREVALKVLPTGTLGDESARKRFRGEALALSKLNHPNIETIYDFDTEDGTDFLVMEHILGETLVAKLTRGALPEKETVSLGSQLVEGLMAAHAQGVIHRDLKPGNLQITPDGRLKLLDFGLAKLMEPVTEGSQFQTLSQTQSTAGTMPYMAPEQLRGEKIDARTDIFALGTVLYEMATGQRAFQEQTTGRLTEVILFQRPQSPSAANPKISLELERIILKCLEKEPVLRYQSATDIAVDLRRLGTPSGAVQPAVVISSEVKPRAVGPVAAIGAFAVVVVLVGLNVGGLRDRLFGGGDSGCIESLAVLPLENLSGDPEQEYFADGMTDALITSLSKISALKVISRTSSMRYKIEDRPPLPVIAQQLGVDALIEGSVLRVGDRVRITAQLIEAATDQHLWAESYERDLDDVLALQGEVARAIAAEIKVKLTPVEETRLASAGSVDPEAYKAYLKGRFHWNKRTEEGFEGAIQFFNRAIKIDPGNARAYAGLADSYTLLGEYSLRRPGEVFPKARAAALKALELDSGLAEARASLAEIKIRYEWDWAGAEEDFKKAIEINSGYATAHQWYGEYLMLAGRMEESLAELKEAQKLDPLSLVINTYLGWNYFFSRRYDDAVKEGLLVVELDANFPGGHDLLARVYVQKGMYEEAISEALNALSVGKNAYHASFLGLIYALSGNEREAMRVLDELTTLSKQQYIDPGLVATIHAVLGDKNQAFSWLERAYANRSQQMIWLKHLPDYDHLRSDPRFDDLLSRVGFPPD
ncbi:MAG: protein kinase [Acidobacteria bacterium]|nr:protein kinase [Acidobacteriota bacterium]